MDTILQLLQTIRPPLRTLWHVTQDRRLRCLTGRDKLQWFGLSLHYTASKHQHSISSILSESTNQIDISTRLEVQKRFPKLFTRQGRAKTFQARSTFIPNFRPIHQKGRRVPLQLQPKVETELERLQRDGHIERLQNCPDRYLCHPLSSR